VFKRRIFLISVSVLLVSGALAQTSSNGQHFAKDGLSFDYPAGWSMDESKTSGQMQYLMLGRDGYATIYVRSPRALVDSPEKEAQARHLIQDGFVEAWAKNFSDNGAKAERSTVPTEIGGGTADCTRLSASLGGEPGRVDICWRLVEKRMVQLAIVGSTRDVTKTGAAWDAIRTSLKVEPPPQPKPTPQPSPAKEKP
jgi:hypothetical protein